MIGTGRRKRIIVLQTVVIWVEEVLNVVKANQISGRILCGQRMVKEINKADYQPNAHHIHRLAVLD